MASKSNAVAVVETPVVEAEVVAAEAVVEQPVVTVEQDVMTEIPLPEGFKGKELLIDQFASDVAGASKWLGGMEVGLQRVIADSTGSALLVSQSKEGVKERVYICPQNILHIQAALASRPSLRPMFKSTVVRLIEEGRKSDEYQKALADLAEIEDNRANVMQNLRALTESYAAPFEADLFVALWSLDKVVEATPTAASAPGKGRAARTASKHHWSAPEYTKVERVGTFYLRQGAFEMADENGISRSYPWAVFDEYGAILAAGTSGADADKNWLASRNMSTNVNSVLRWNVVATEEALAA